MSSGILDALTDVLPFLKWHSPFDYKKQVLDHLLGTTGTSEGLLFMANNCELIKALTQLVIEDRSREIQEFALKILVNTSTTTLSDECVKVVLKDKFLETLLELMVSKIFSSANYCAMFLTNITKDTMAREAVYEVITKKNKNNNVSLTMEILLDIFCDIKYNQYCDLDHVGSLLANLTMLKEARMQLLDREQKFLQKLLPFTQFVDSNVRRHAVASIIKNVLFETDYHEWLLSDDVELLTFLLLPLSGPEELSSEEMDELPLDLQYLPPDKKREKDISIQILLVESLFQLCATKTCRLKLKNSGVYYILREFHKFIGEKDDGLKLPLENAIQILIGDEPEEGKENILEVEVPEKIQKRFTEMDSQQKTF